MNNQDAILQHLAAMPESEAGWICDDQGDWWPVQRAARAALAGEVDKIHFLAVLETSTAWRATEEPWPVTEQQWQDR